MSYNNWFFFLTKNEIGVLITLNFFFIAFFSPPSSFQLIPPGKTNIFRPLFTNFLFFSFSIDTRYVDSFCSMMSVVWARKSMNHASAMVFICCCLLFFRSTVWAARTWDYEHLNWIKLNVPFVSLCVMTYLYCTTHNKCKW